MNNSILTNSPCTYKVEDWKVETNSKGQVTSRKKIGIHEEQGIFIKFSVEGCSEEFYTRAIILTKEGTLICKDLDEIKIDVQGIKEER